MPSTLRGELLLDHANLSQAEKLVVMTPPCNNLEFDTVAEAFVKQHAIAHSLNSPDTQHKKEKEKAGQEAIMVLRKTGMDVTNPWTSSRNQKRTLQMKMKAGKAGEDMACTPGLQEQTLMGYDLGTCRSIMAS